jgi:hypothetical protein
MVGALAVSLYFPDILWGERLFWWLWLGVEEEEADVVMQE